MITNNHPYRFLLNSIFWSLIILGITIPVSGQQTIKLSVSQALKIASENNKVIQKSKLQEQVSILEVKEKKQLRLPEIDFHASYSRITNLTEFQKGMFSDKKVTHTIPEMYDLKTTSRTPIYMGSKIRNSIKKAEQESEMASIAVEKTENDIHIEVVASYLGIYKLMELQKIIEENIKEQEDRLKEVMSFRAHGTVKKDEVLRAELQLSDMELALMKNKKNIAIATFELQTLLQLPEEDRLELDTTNLIATNSLLEPYAFYVKATLQNEEMRITEKELEEAKTEQKIIKGNYLPTISFFTSYAFNYPNYMFFPPDPYLYTLGQVGVEATFSLSNLYKNKTKMQIANKKIEVQETQKEVVRNEMMDKVFKQYTQYQEITDQFPVNQKAVTLAAESYRIIKVKYLNHLILVTDMLDADNALLTAKYNVVSTQIDATMKYYELLYTAGILKVE